MTLRRLWRGRGTGVSALEFALSAPLVFFVMIGIADFGNALQQSIRLEGAARAGAQVALASPYDSAAIRAASMANLAGWRLVSEGGDVTFASQNWCQCATDPISPANGFSCTNYQGNCTDVAHLASVTLSRPYHALLLVPVTTLRGNVELRLR